MDNTLAIKNKTGSPVTGNDFFNRVAELREIESLLKEGNNLLISAPRRIGKTSLLWALKKKLKTDYGAILINLEGRKDEKELFECLFREISKELHSWQKAKQKILKFIDGIKVDFSVSDYSLSFSANGEKKEARDIIEEILKGIQKPILFLMDEFSVFLSRLVKKKKGIERAEHILGIFRSFRQEESIQNIRWIFCGSIGLDMYVQKWNLSSSINDLHNFDLGAFGDHDADALLEALSVSSRIPLEKPLRDNMLRRIGWKLPYFIQLYFHTLKRVRSKSENREKTVDDHMIRLAYDDMLASQNASLSHWKEKLKEQLEREELEQAHTVLDFICATPDGGAWKNIYDKLRTLASVQTEGDTDRVIGILIHDGYLLKEKRDGENRYDFRSPILKDYWKTGVNR